MVFRGKKRLEGDWQGGSTLGFFCFHACDVVGKSENSFLFFGHAVGGGFTPNLVRKKS